jgi:CRP-like cAMP-binding protein
MTPDIAKKIDDFFSKYPKRSYPKGQILIFADEKPENIFYVTKGRVRMYDVSYRGEEVIVNIFKPPAFFPMSSAINKSDNQFFYKTDTDTELHIAPGEVVLTFIKDNPDVMLDLLSRLYRGMDGLLGRVVHLMAGTAKSRLLYELIVECRRFGEQQANGSYLLTMSERDLAARSGLTRETVNRELKKMKDQALIRFGNKGLIINDLAGIEKILGRTI